ncbi:MAG TPA: transcription termination factor NusA [Anaerolineae bacterium]|nr:transcription termination factor NusA [Anaerolineae bacterium]
MKTEFAMAMNQICSERNLPQEVIFEAIESALVSAYKRNFGSSSSIKAEIDFTTGEPHVYEERIVVEEIEDDQFEITLKEALKIDPEVEPGGLVRQEVTPKSFGRIAAQTAKQVILQRIREAERDALFTSYADREGELINGMVANITPHSITLNLGRTEAVMPRNQQVPGERYRIGQRIRAFVMEVRRTNRGPQIVVSRAHRDMLRRLLEIEVPEIFSGTVEIKSIAREAGKRTKVAVSALQTGVDPVGSCVGVRGMRIQSIVAELGGEKIDVVEWNADPSTFIANALSPARVNYVVLSDPDSNRKTATVVVPDDQLSLAIGKQGQNARLGAKLTGWRIDIKGASEATTEGLRPGLQYMPSVTREQRDILAMAEAILLGKERPPAKQEVEPAVGDAEAEVELAEAEVDEVPAAVEASTVVAEADALLDEEAAPAEAEVAEELEAAELEAYAAGAALEEPAVAADAEVAGEEVEELEPEPEEEEKQPVRPSPPRGPQYRYVGDEQLDEIVSGQKKSRPRPRQLVLDEETGQLVSQPRHKRGEGDDVDWENVDY